MTASLEKQLFDSAKAYYLGANIIMKPSNSSPADSHLLIQPAVTCAALSLKLFLKCMRALDGSDKDDIYRIAELYRSLSEAMRSRFLQKYDEFSNTPSSSDDLIRHFEALDNAFINWRYIHEDDMKSVNIEDLEEMILAAKATITSIRTDWA